MSTWAETHKEYPNIRYSFWLRLEIKFFLIGLGRDIWDAKDDFQFWLRDPFHKDPQALTGDALSGTGFRWWLNCLGNSMVLALLFCNPIEYVKNCTSRKLWWDGMTETQRHYIIEQQNMLVEGMLESLEKLTTSLKEKPC